MTLTFSPFAVVIENSTGSSDEKAAEKCSILNNATPYCPSLAINEPAGLCFLLGSAAVLLENGLTAAESR